MTATTWANRKQAATLVTADSYGEAWSEDEIAIVAAFTDDVTDEELATTLGRSLYAIWNIQHRIRTGDIDVTANARRAAVNARDARTCPTCSLVLLPTGACPVDC